MPVGSRLVNKPGTGIELGAEFYQQHKDRKPSSRHYSGGTSPNVSQIQRVTQARNDDAGADSDESDLDDDESTWALDEASEELCTDPSPYIEFEPEAGRTRSSLKAIEKNFATRFLSAHPRSQIRPFITPLPVPVVIPQRRPGEASRGFVLAYPPLLGDHAGIDQQTFLELLHALNTSCQSSDTLEVINMAAFAAMFSPSVISHVASFSVHATSSVDDETRSGSQRSTFLDKINAEFFQPRGLWCMVVTWKSQARESRLVNFNVAGNIRSTIKASNTNSDVQLGRSQPLGKSISTSSSTTSGHLDMDICAPLTYPSLDNASAIPERTPLHSNQDFVTTYLDRRARLHGHKVTDQTTQATKSRRTNRLGKQAEHDPNLAGSKVAKDNKGIRRLIRQDVCYLMVVNYPAQQPQQH